MWCTVIKQNYNHFQTGMDYELSYWKSSFSTSCPLDFCGIRHLIQLFSIEESLKNKQLTKIPRRILLSACFIHTRCHRVGARKVSDPEELLQSVKLGKKQVLNSHGKQWERCGGRRHILSSRHSVLLHLLPCGKRHFAGSSRVAPSPSSRASRPASTARHGLRDRQKTVNAEL